MNKLIIPVINNSPNELPEYATPNSAGMDLRAWVGSAKHSFIKGTSKIKDKNGNTVIRIMPGGRCAIDTGLQMALPEGYEGQVRPRSGMALRYGITVLNTPGCVDADFRGSVGVILINLSDEVFTINEGDRIAQYIISPCTHGEWEETDNLDSTERGSGAYGHSGIN